MKARIKNISNRNVVIDTDGFWRYVTEKALDQSTSTLFNVPLNVPKMRGTIGDSFRDEHNTSQFTKLKSNKSRTMELMVNPTTDDFYRTAGRYSITSMYRASGNPAVDGSDLFIGTVTSPEFHFEIAECTTRSDRLE